MESALRLNNLKVICSLNITSQEPERQALITNRADTAQVDGSIIRISLILQLLPIVFDRLCKLTDHCCNTVKHSRCR